MLDNPKFEFFNHGRNGRAVMMADEDENITIMQFTGLKDKRGKEIYEGDIIVSVENDEVYAIGEMTPLSRHLDMLADNIGYFTDKMRKKYEKRNPQSRYHIDDWVSWSEQYEVIGNIYETPELISSQSNPKTATP